MKKAWLISIILHIAILIFAFLTLNYPRQLDELQDFSSLPVKIAIISDENAMRKGDIKASSKKPPSSAGPKNDIVSKYDNKQKSELDTNQAFDKWVKTVSKRNESAAKDSAKAPLEAKPQIKSQEKTQPKKPDKEEEQLNPNPKAESKAQEKPANKTQNKSQEQAAAKKLAKKPREDEQAKILKKAQDNGQKDGLDKLIEESLMLDKARSRGGGKNASKGEAGQGGPRDMGQNEVLAQTLAAKISNCVRSKFNVIALGGSAEQNLKIRARFRLKEDGSLEKIEEVSAQGGDDRLQEIGINQARAALANCSPFSLPREYYSLWREVDMIFDPYAMEDENQG